jgi:hypothetical protein
VPGLTETLETGRKSIVQVIDLLNQGIVLMDDIITGVRNIVDGVSGLIVTVNEMCPRIRFPICTDITDSSTCNMDGIFNETNVVGALIDHFASNKTILWSLEHAHTDMVGLLHGANELDESLATLDWVMNLSIFFSVLLAFLCFWMIIGITFRLPRILNSLQSRLLFPTFVFLVVISFVFAIGFIFGSIGIADACVDSPDDKILAVLHHYLDQISPIIYEFVLLYLSRKFSTSE